MASQPTDRLIGFARRLLRGPAPAAPVAPPTLSKTHFETHRPLRPPVGLARDLYQDAAQRAAVDAALRPLLDDPETLKAIQRDEIPIPATEDREGYFDDRHLAYWLSGLSDLRAIQASSIPPEAFASVLDLGGASGRVARHLASARSAPNVTIAELNINHTEWVDQYFPPSVRAVKLGPYPHLPLPDQSVTLCLAFSVFTHLDTYETGWLAEIRRVLAVGGFAYITIHSEDSWSLLPNVFVYRTLKDNPDFVRLFVPGQPMPGERLVFDYNPNSIEYSCNIFLHSNYIRKRWGKWLEVIAIRPRAHDKQTAVVLRRSA